MMLFIQITRKKTNTKTQNSFTLTVQDLGKDGSTAAGTQQPASSKQASGVTVGGDEVGEGGAEGPSGRKTRQSSLTHVGVTHADVTHAHAASLTVTQRHSH